MGVRPSVHRIALAQINEGGIFISEFRLQLPKYQLTYMTGTYTASVQTDGYSNELIKVDAIGSRRQIFVNL